MEVSGQKTLVLSFASALILSAFVTSQLFIQKAHADGIFQHEIDAQIGDRNAKLSLQINPPVLTSATQQDAFVQLRLFDANTNQTIPHTTYFITATKGTPGNEERIFQDFFHAHNGLLRLKVQPQPGELTIFGTREDYLKALVADPNGTINIRGPFFLEGGLYHFNIMIFGIDVDTQIFPPGEEPEFDSWLSVGDVFNESVQYQNQNYNVTIISYYDQVNEFDFDADTQTLTWSMPFDWDTDRIRSTEIFVHEELKVPKSLEGLGDSVSFKATANGMPITGSQLSIDPYSSETDLTLHYLINKNQILALAQQVPEGTDTLKFTLAPDAEGGIQTTGEMVTDTGGVNIALDWAPSPLNADSESTVKLSFSDAFSAEQITRDVMYDLRVLDDGGNEVYSKPGLTAQGGTDTQTIDFPSNENYRMEIEVTGLASDDQQVDRTRNGIARGIVVVPEFPTGAILAMGGVIGAVLLLQRLRK